MAFRVGPIGKTIYMSKAHQLVNGVFNLNKNIIKMTKQLNHSSFAH